MNIPNMNYYNYFVTIFYTERSTNLQPDSKTRNKLAFRSSRSQMFYKIRVLENFAKFAVKYLSLSHFLIKLYALRGSLISVFLGVS